MAGPVRGVGVRVVVTGASGNLGTSILARLVADPGITEVVGVCRRRPDWRPERVTWTPADITVADLDPIVRGADVVVHLAWLIQPSRRPRAMWATNVVGTRRLADAVARTGVPALVTATSVGAYAPAPPGVVVDESWPTDGVPESTYSWQKALQERTLDVLAASCPGCRVVRVRPALVFKRAAAREIRKLFIGRILPLRFLSVEPAARVIERLPLSFQVVHADDLADAFHSCVTTSVDGAFNVAAPGVLGRDGDDGRRLAGALRPIVAAAWRARLVPVDPGWITLGASAPTMSTRRATDELDWRPVHDGPTVLRELLDGLREDDSFPTPPLQERRLPRARP